MSRPGWCERCWVIRPPDGAEMSPSASRWPYHYGRHSRGRSLASSACGSPCGSPLESLELRAQPSDLSFRFLAPPGFLLAKPLCFLAPPGFLLAKPLCFLAALGFLLGTPLGGIVHRLDPCNELLALQQQRRARVEPEPVFIDLDLETEHPRLVQPMVRDDGGVDAGVG